MLEGKSTAGTKPKWRGFLQTNADWFKVVGFMLVLLGGAYGYGELNQRVKHLETTQKDTSDVVRSLQELRTEFKYLNQTVRRLETKVEKLN